MNSREKKAVQRRNYTMAEYYKLDHEIRYSHYARHLMEQLKKSRSL